MYVVYFTVFPLAPKFSQPLTNDKDIDHLNIRILVNDIGLRMMHKVSPTCQMLVMVFCVVLRCVMLPCVALCCAVLRYVALCCVVRCCVFTLV